MSRAARKYFWISYNAWCRNREAIIAVAMWALFCFGVGAACERWLLS